jgi:hypothetical protein
MKVLKKCHLFYNLIMNSFCYLLIKKIICYIYLLNHLKRINRKEIYSFEIRIPNEYMIQQYFIRK